MCWLLISITIFIPYWLNDVRMMNFMKSSIFPIWLYQINTATWRWFCPMTHFPRCTSTSGHCFSMSAKIEGFFYPCQRGTPAPTSVLSRSLRAGRQSSHHCPRSSRRCERCLRLRRGPEFLLGMHDLSLFCAKCSTRYRICGGVKIVNWAFSTWRGYRRCSSHWCLSWRRSQLVSPPLQSNGGQSNNSLRLCLEPSAALRICDSLQLLWFTIGQQ